MSSDLSAIRDSTANEMRMKNYREQLQRRFDSDIHEMEASHQDDVVRILDHNIQQLDTLRNAYEVRISEEAEALEEKLHQVHSKAEARVDAEKRAGDEELARVKLTSQKRIEEYKKRSDEQVETLQKQLQASTSQLHEQAKKSARKEKESSGHE